MLQTQTVAEDTLALIKRLMADRRLNDFILVGGTALALRMGHRKSLDIDLFSPHSFDADLLATQLQADYQATEIKPERNSIRCYIDEIKVDLITYPYPEVEPHQVHDGIRIMSLVDIAAMKLHAITDNGERPKDFVDVYFLLEKMPLSKMYAAYEKKYFPLTNAVFAKTGLGHTADVKFNEPIQLLDRPFNWESVKKRLLEARESPQKTFLTLKGRRGPDLNNGRNRGLGR